MTDYSDVVKGWKDLYHRYYYQDMPFFRVIMDKFCKNTNKGDITPEEMKSLILHYKNALNEYKQNLLVTEYDNQPVYRKYCLLRKKIQSEYENLLQIYDDLLNVEDMTNGQYKNITRTTKKID